MRNAHVLLLVLSLAACNKKRERWNAIAEQANPVILELRKPVSIVLSPTSTAVDVVTACIPAMETARRLAAMDFGDRNAGSSTALTINDVLHDVPFELNTRCDGASAGSADAAHVASCAKLCRERFGELADAVDRVRKLAAEADSKIETLR